ncbi:hypothetical protein [Pseudactinotalea sp. HY158]|uniref:COG1470 family protein n=1 Tax=Pseudactinotalea sp. HY158 TaxID=2654547 RepID=UPI00129C4FA3|nr:hypothetical protein [Pseudactinotalea sp. HY158]QGH68298.1 hypothetical protein GCE65_01295 [Pseudactinotalea sp. HY158]
MRRHPTVSSAVTITAAVLALLGTAPGPALASADPANSVTWTVRPSDGNVADGRTWVELDLDPGAVVDDHLIVTNLGDDPVDFRLTAADGYLTESGHFTMLPSHQESTDAGAWIAIAEDVVSVDAGGSVVVPFTVRIPANATPGDHPAGVAASVVSTGRAQDGASMGVESRVGFRVMTRVTGELAPAVEIGDVVANYRMSWNFLSPGSIDLSYDVSNSGNTRLVTSPQQESTGVFNGPPEVVPGDGEVELLPGGSRTVHATIANVWPIGLVTLTVRAGADVPEGGVDAPADAVRQIVIVAIPWPQLLAAGGAALLVIALVWRRRASGKKVAAMLAEARDAGAREALNAYAPAGDRP